MSFVLQEWEQPLEQLLKGPALDTYDRVEIEASAKTVILLQENPAIAADVLFGVYVPPHERLMLGQFFRGTATNINVSSRGTSKSAVWCSLGTSLKGMLHAKRKAITLGSTGFRAGQNIFNEIQRLAEGAWDSQEQGLGFLTAASTHRDGLIHRGQNFWTIPWASHSTNTTLPTNDPTKILGYRANDLILDEANVADEQLVAKVLEPFLNVAGDFRHGGAYAKANQAFFVTTIDWLWRPFQARRQAALDSLRRELRALELREVGDIEAAFEIEKTGVHAYSYTSFDYSDLLIREFQTTRDGRQFKVNYPNPDFKLKMFHRGVPFTTRDPETGKMLKLGPAVRATPTYPVDVDQLERGLFDGSTDESVWLAEQRNIVDSTTGDVFPQVVIDQASCEGERHVIPYAQCSDGWKAKFAKDQRDYAPTPLWRCSDPCVAAIDYAGGSRDFCAFSVIRVGPLAEGGFDPLTQHGKTDWSNVVWAEQHRRMSHKEAADKLREFADRYNLVWFYDEGVEDEWQMARAVGLDMRGGGTGVRDQLLLIDQEELLPGQHRWYDPLDKDERVVAFGLQAGSLAMLDCISPSDERNQKMVEWILPQMQQGFLYLMKWYDRSDRPDPDPRLEIAYNAGRSLVWQLRKLKAEPTKNWMRYYVEGDTKKVENKKDLASSLLYAGRQHRAHILRQRAIDDAPPPMGASVTVIGKRGGGNGRAAGTGRRHI